MNIKQSLSKPVPHEIRHNPFARIPPLTIKDLNQGLYTLVNQGYLPKYVDITPALQRDDPIIQTRHVDARSIIISDALFDLNLDESALRRRVSHSNTVTAANANRASPSQSIQIKSNDQVEQAALITQPIEDSKKGSQFSKFKQKKEEVREKDKLRGAIKKYLGQDKQKIQIVNGLVKMNSVYQELRGKNLMVWGDIEDVIDQIISFAGSYKISNFKIYIDKTKELSILMRQPTNHELSDSIESFQKLQNFIKDCGGKIHSIDQTANLYKYAIKIQRTYRKKMAKRLADKLSVIKKNISMIQFQIRLKHVYRDTVKQTAVRNAEKYKDYLKIQAKFADEWEQICSKPRVEVHLNSLSSFC